jgi:ParB family chromosome partitioning protein
LPRGEDDLWDTLTAFDRDSHCASLSVNAVQEQWNRNPRRLAHADRLARAVNLDIVGRLAANRGANCSPDNPAWRCGL